jgi:hypothetical protein
VNKKEDGQVGKGLNKNKRERRGINKYCTIEGSKYQRDQQRRGF